jgi:uncharacterized protein
MITDPWFYALAIPAVLMVGMSKSGFGGGIALIGVPLLTLSVSPIKAVAILLPVLIAMDMIGLIAYRRRVNWPAIAVLLPAAIVGIGIGWLTASFVTDGMVRLIVGLIALTFTLDHWFGRRKDKAARTPNRIAGSIWGTVAGFTSFVSHAGGAPLQMYLLPLRFDPVLYAGTSIVFFAAVNALKVIPYFALGLFSAENLATSAVLIPFAAIAMLAGIWLVRNVPAGLFYRIAYVLVFVISIKLIWDGALSFIS